MKHLLNIVRLVVIVGFVCHFINLFHPSFALQMVAMFGFGIANGSAIASILLSINEDND